MAGSASTVMYRILGHAHAVPLGKLLCQAIGKCWSKTCLGMKRAAKCTVHIGLFELKPKHSWAVERGEVKVAMKNQAAKEGFFAFANADVVQI